ncbi:hypothetical protein ACT7DJ_00955 [Bacillus cereus]
MAKPSKKKQEEWIQAEINRLHTIFAHLPVHKKEIVKELIERVAFYDHTTGNLRGYDQDKRAYVRVSKRFATYAY